MKKGLIIAIIVILAIGSIFIYKLISNKQDAYLVYENGQMGIVTSKNKKTSDIVLIENQEVEVYQTFSNLIQINYESYNLDNNYHNTLIINNNHEFKLTSSREDYTNFVSNTFEVLGLNIVNGNLTLTFKAGSKLNDNLNSFSLRNIFIKVDEVEIWSNEFPKSDYLNEFINFGEDDLNDDFRFNYQSSRTLSFTIPNDLLNVNGAILSDYSDKESLAVNYHDQELILENESYIDISCNIENGEIIENTKELRLSVPENTSYEVKIDGIIIDSDITFTKNAWASGEHYLTISASNNHGFKLTKIITFTLTDIDNESLIQNKYQIYQTGVSATLESGIDNFGVNIGNDETSTIITQDGNYLTTPFSSYPVINMIVEKSEDTTLLWVGKVNSGRTAFMQIYNHVDNKWETVSTNLSTTDENINLGYDHKNQTKYINNNLIYVRISSSFNELSKENITNRIVQMTDIQYINQMLTNSGVDSSIGKQALAALKAMVDYIISEYQNNNLEYMLLTGDLVQQQRGVTIEEWETFNTYVLEPLLAAGVPLGVSSGNHDIGAISSYNEDGVNTLDEDLIYDYYSQYVGQSVFENFDYYGDSFQDNRSHYDLMTINGHEFLFLYLGWGSSIPNIHVSTLDIEWAKSVLDLYPDKTVVLATHEYMTSKSTRTATGEYLFEYLVKDYSNIKFVFSGHINGSSKKIDVLDDNGDGINDRMVLQMLTDFQEEENLYGASFMRIIGLNFVDNVIYFNQYSPFFNDSDIFVINNIQYIKESQEYYYAFDLSKIEYGILTDYFG